MKVQIQPREALCDKKLTIVITELRPKERVEVHASTCLPWSEEVLFESHASFTAEPDGIVDLSRQKPESGSYDFADSMGLILSMKSRDKNAMKKISQNISVDKNQTIEFRFTGEEDTFSVQVTRKFLTEGIRRAKISDGFAGELFYHEDTSLKTIVFLGGSGSGFAVNAPIAAVLASHGFQVLSLPYFNEEGLPSGLSEIPLEYFERVFQWLSSDVRTKCGELSVFGVSKGAELSLLLASRYRFIRKVAALAPHAYCFQGIAFRNASSWTYHGEQLPYIRLKNSWVFCDMLRCIYKNQPFGFTPTYVRGVNAAKNREEARIRVENANADLLLFSGTQNNMWNSCDGCNEIIHTLKDHHYPHDYSLITYENAGEPFYVPYVIPAGESSLKIAPRLVLSQGGTIQGNAYAVSDSWERTICFFKMGKLPKTMEQ